MKDFENSDEFGVTDADLLEQYRKSRLSKSVSATALFRRCPKTITAMLNDGLTNSQIAEFLGEKVGKPITGQRVGQILIALDFPDPRRTKSKKTPPPQKPPYIPHTDLPELLPTGSPYHDPLKNTHLGKDFQARGAETLERRKKYQQQKKSS